VRLGLEVRGLLGGGSLFSRNVLRRDPRNPGARRCRWIGAFLDQPFDDVGMLAERGDYQRRNAIMLCSIDVSAKLLDEAPQHSKVSVPGDQEYRRAACSIWLVYIGTEFLDQAPNDIQMRVLADLALVGLRLRQTP
jgi:hypothetical protein